MMRKVLLGLTLFFCVAFGWALGYVRLPYLEESASFGVGFVGGMGVIIFVWALWRLSASNWLSKGSHADEPVSNEAHQRIRAIRLTLALLLTILAISCFNLYMMNGNLAEEVEDCREEVRLYKLRVDSVEQSRWMVLMRDLLALAKAEVDQSADNSLTEPTINRIVAFSKQFHPHRSSDSLSHLYSPQRGQLLLALLNLQLNDESLTELKRRVSFSGADLRHANLSKYDLTDIDLSSSDLRHTNLSQVNLDGANLMRADLSFAKGENASFLGSNLKRAALVWAELDGANFRQANLDGANLTNGKFRKSNLDSASLQWVDAGHAFLVEANGANSNWTGAKLYKTNLTKAILTGANFKQATVNHVILSGAEVDSSWQRSIVFPSINGGENLAKRYDVKKDTAANQAKYLLHLNQD